MNQETCSFMQAVHQFGYSCHSLPQTVIRKSMQPRGLSSGQFSIASLLQPKARIREAIDAKISAKAIIGMIFLIIIQKETAHIYFFPIQE